MQTQHQYKIVQSTKDELINYYNIQDGLGWEPFENCPKFIEASGIQGCFFGKINGNIISSIISMKYEKYGYISVYWVKQQFRGKGYGLPIFNKAIQYLKDCDIIGLESGDDLIKNYQKSGFETHCNSLQNYAFVPPQNQILTNKTTLILTNKNDVEVQKIAAFDSKYFPYNRISVIQAGIDLGQIIVSLDPNSKQIKGYGIVNKMKKSVCLSPLIAQTSEVAQDIIKTMFQKYPCQSQSFNICYLDSHQYVSNLIKKWFPFTLYNLKRMYKRNKNNAEIDSKCIYGLTFQRG